MLDLAIIGSGPAAMTAALYAARAGLSVKVFEKEKMGGALWQIANIENYPGFVGKGEDLALAMREQAERAGADIGYGELKNLFCDLPELTSEDEGARPVTTGPSDPCRKRKFLTLKIDDEEVSARAAIIATGSEPCQLGFAVKPPVSYCALCDGALYKGKSIAVVGGGNSAVQEALYLADIVGELTLFSRSKLKADCCIVNKLRAKDNVKIVEQVELTPELLEDFAAVFVFIGKRPAAAFMPSGTVTSDGYIKVKSGHKTMLDGVLAAGDVREGSVRQVVTAAADGAAAALEAIDFLKGQSV